MATPSVWRARIAKLLLFLSLPPSCTFAIDRANSIVVHEGICDASGVVDLGQGRFAVADDELNMLLVYEIDGNGKAIYQAEISKFLDVVTQPKEKKAKKKAPKKKPAKKKKQQGRNLKVKEVDIEGAARVGDTVYWIASHGRKSSGKEATERMRFFATTIIESGDRIELLPKGIPYDDLLADLVADPRYAQFGLQEAAAKAPKEPGGLSIEAITDTPQGTLLVGFRNPLIEGKALVATILNPEEVLRGREAEFGNPLLLDLAGNGIRGMTSHENDFILAANDPEGDGNHPLLFRWDGNASRAMSLNQFQFGDFNPEAVAFLPNYRGGSLLVISDDGSRLVGPEQCKCKDLKDHSQRRFRSLTFSYSNLQPRPSNKPLP